MAVGTQNKVLVVFNDHGLEPCFEKKEVEFDELLSSSKREVEYVRIADSTVMAPLFSPPVEEQDLAMMKGKFDDSVGIIGRIIKDAAEVGAPFKGIVYIGDFAHQIINRNSFTKENLSKWLDSIKQAVGSIPTALFNLTVSAGASENQVINFQNPKNAFADGKPLLSRISAAVSRGEEIHELMKAVPAFDVSNLESTQDQDQFLKSILNHLDTVFANPA